MRLEAFRLNETAAARLAVLTTLTVSAPEVNQKKNKTQIKMNFKFTLCTFFILIASTSARSMAIFSSKPGEVETSPSLQLLLRNVGLGLITDPIFFRIKKRWDVVRSR